MTRGRKSRNSMNGPGRHGSRRTYANRRRVALGEPSLVFYSMSVPDCDKKHTKQQKHSSDESVTSARNEKADGN